MATGALDSNGIWQYGEDDSNTTFSALLNRLGASTSTQIGLLKQPKKILQIVTNSYSNWTANSTNVQIDTGLTATITPTSATSKILVLVAQNGLSRSAGSSNNALDLYLYRNTTSLAWIYGIGLTYTAVNIFGLTASFSYLDSPATTAATTYKTRFQNEVNGPEVSAQRLGDKSTITLIEVSA